MSTDKLKVMRVPEFYISSDKNKDVVNRFIEGNNDPSLLRWCLVYNVLTDRVGLSLYSVGMSLHIYPGDYLCYSSKTNSFFVVGGNNPSDNSPSDSNSSGNSPSDSNSNKKSSFTVEVLVVDNTWP